jgi:hypothetical protein
MARNLAFALYAVVFCLLFTSAGCSRKDESGKQKVETAPAKEGVVRKETTVSVPPEVRKKWKSVKLSIVDKQNGKEGFITIPIGKTVKVNETNLVIKVENFLPHFIMDGTTLTSSTNTPKNPAVQVHITENGKDVFKGWLFTLYPNTHATQHPRYGFGLVDFSDK